jgi:hypothetical protein
MRALEVALLVFAATGVADASEINRCVALDGVLVYTDRPCVELGTAARATTMPRRRVGSAPPASALSRGCAASSPEGMRSAVMDALDRRDFNALSGLYNFDGRSSWTAAPVVRRLERMAKRSAFEVELVPVETESLFDVLIADPSVLPTLRVVQPGGAADGPVSVGSFRLLRSAGCLWLAG